MQSKLKSLSELKSIAQSLKSSGKKLVTTNGVFDILHVGHVRYLSQAKSLGDILIVGINSDTSVRKIKGPERPINPEQDRAEILSSLEPVDYILIFSEQTPVKWLSEIKPDIHVKGGDYTQDKIIEKDVVESSGGKIIILPLVKGKSTTGILQKLTSSKPALKNT